MRVVLEQLWFSLLATRIVSCRRRHIPSLSVRLVISYDGNAFAWRTSRLLLLLLWIVVICGRRVVHTTALRSSHFDQTNRDRNDRVREFFTPYGIILVLFDPPSRTPSVSRGPVGPPILVCALSLLGRRFAWLRERHVSPTRRPGPAHSSPLSSTSVSLSVLLFPSVDSSSVDIRACRRHDCRSPSRGGATLTLTAVLTLTHTWHGRACLLLVGELTAEWRAVGDNMGPDDKLTSYEAEKARGRECEREKEKGWREHRRTITDARR